MWKQKWTSKEIMLKSELCAPEIPALNFTN